MSDEHATQPAAPQTPRPYRAVTSGAKRSVISVLSSGRSAALAAICCLRPSPPGSGPARGCVVYSPSYHTHNSCAA